MKKITAFLLICISLFIRCKKDEKHIYTTPFNIENLNNIKVKSFNNINLYNQGYNRIVANLLIYEKTVKDTLVQLEFDGRSGIVKKKSWKLKLAKDELELKNYIQKKYGVISYDSYTKRDYENNVFYFPVISLQNNSVFLCYTNKNNNQYYLNIDYYNEQKKR